MNKERTILYLFSINAIIYIASGFYTPFLSAYYAQKGIDAEKIGILLMIGPCVVLLTQRFWAKISDRTGKRKEVLLVTIVGSGFSMLLYYLGNSFLCMFFATVVVTSFTTAVIPLSDAILIARSLKEGYSYSIIRLGGTLGYAVMTICAGMYLKTRPQMQFVFAFFAYMILFCFCIGLKEERNGQIVINEVVQENEQNRIFKNRDVYIVLGLAFVSQMGLSFYTGFIGPYILEKGYTQSTIGVINSISALSEVPVLFYINRMLRKHGTIKILFLSCFLMGIRILLPIRSGIIGIVLAQLLQGVTYMTMAALEEMKRKGYIRYVGVSNFTAEQIKEAEQYIQIDVQQPLYSMVDRGFEDLMSWGYDRGIDSMTYGSMGAGILSGKIRSVPSFEKNDLRLNFYDVYKEPKFSKIMELLKVMDSIADGHNVPVGQVALNWSTQKEYVGTALVGVRSIEHADENCKTFDWKLTEEEMKILDSKIEECAL